MVNLVELIRANWEVIPRTMVSVLNVQKILLLILLVEHVKNAQNSKLIQEYILLSKMKEVFT